MTDSNDTVIRIRNLRKQFTNNHSEQQTVLDDVSFDVKRGEKPHANRTLFYDHVVVAPRLAFFNPAVVGLRKIEDAFENRSVRKHFGTPRVPRSAWPTPRSGSIPHCCCN